MNVFVVQEIETKDECEPTSEIFGVFTSYRAASERLIRRSYKPLPTFIFRQPNKHYIEFTKRDGLYEYQAEIHELEMEE